MTTAARAMTSPELVLARTEGQWGKYRAAFLAPTTVYTARVNQTFATTDKIVEITYDGGSGTLGNVLADMTMLVGSSAGAHDIGIVRVRSIDSTKVYIGRTSHIAWADNLYLTILRDWSLWAKHILIDDNGVAYMDAGVTYSDQHTKFDPIPIMGSHRVLKLTGASVSTVWSFADSYVPDSTISTYSTSAPSASATSGTTTSTPTTTFNTVGWHPVYLTVTSALSKSFWAVRWVYVWSEADPPPFADFPQAPRQDAESGGWQFEIKVYDADPTVIRDRALVIIFEEGYYGTTTQSLGQLAGCENIVVTGWIGGEEEIHWNPLQGSVTFTGYTAHYWLSRIPAFPDGVRFVTGTPSRWIEIKRLTIDKGLHHFLHWRTTATRVMDVLLTGDTKYVPEMYSLASNLWEQIREISFLKMFARAGVDRFNRLFIRVHPQLTPTADRTWATVMTITKEDLVEEIDFRRITVPPNAVVDLSTVFINENGKGFPYFSLSPGTLYPQYGSIEILDHLLGDGQAQSNTLAGLYRGWLNNELPNIPVKLLANNRMIDCFPNQKCSITIASTDTPRGISKTIGLIPKEVSLVPDKDTGYLHTEVIFEAETFPDIAINGIVPGSGDVSVPPLPPLPPLPPIEIIVPGTIEPTLEGPPKLLIVDRNIGLLYSSNFNALSPGDVEFATVNAGLTVNQYLAINDLHLTPSGGVYVLHRRRNFGDALDPFIAYAPAIGATFTVIEDQATIQAKLPFTDPAHWGVNALGVNPLTGQVAYVISTDTKTALFIGTGTTFAEAVDLTTNIGIGSVGNLSFGFDNWRLTGATSNAYFVAISADGSTIIRAVSGSTTMGQQHIPISTSDKCILYRSSALRIITQNGAVAGDFTTAVGSLVLINDHWDNKIACDPTGMLIMLPWDTGQRGKSSDGGATIVGIPNLPFGGVYAYDYAGGAGAESRWVAGNGILRYSPDFGDSWINREGNLLSVAPVPSISIVKVVEY